MLLRVSTGALIAFSLFAGTARADATAHTCERLRAEARAEAVVLYAPRITVEGARAPSVVDAGDPVGVTDGFQARASLGFSATDALRGRAIERIADAECARTIAADRAGRVLGVGVRFGELAATRAEIAYLERSLPEIDALLGGAVERFEHQRATAIEVDEMRTRRASFRIRLTAARREAGELELLEQQGAPGAPALAALATDVRATEIELDRRRAALRTIAAWTFDVRAGVAGGEKADWFAVVELGYSLGQPFQAKANRRAIHAREAEARADDRSVAGQLDHLQRAMQRSVTDLAAEVTTIETELAAQTAERDRIAAVANDAA
ncbi:MAG: hypothetical protein ABI175_04230, partial [Polyangiales bacterium]